MQEIVCLRVRIFFVFVRGEKAEGGDSICICNSESIFGSIYSPQIFGRTFMGQLIFVLVFSFLFDVVIPDQGRALTACTLQLFLNEGENLGVGVVSVPVQIRARSAR